MFCMKCGFELLENAKFCTKCGEPTDVRQSELRNSYSMYTLKVVRAKQWFLINPSIKITVDGCDDYEVKSGESVNIPIKAGGHNIAFSSSFSNKIVDMNVTGNMVLNIKFNRITGSIELN